MKLAILSDPHGLLRPEVVELGLHLMICGESGRKLDKIQEQASCRPAPPSFSHRRFSPSGYAVPILFDFLLQAVKFRREEKFAQGDLQPITQIFDGDDRNILPLFVQHTILGGGHLGKGKRRFIRFFLESKVWSNILLSQYYSPPSSDSSNFSRMG